MGQVKVLRCCNNDIGGHLFNCHLSVESLTETDLILGRASLFSVTETQIGIMSICPRHRFLRDVFGDHQDCASTLIIKENLLPWEKGMSSV